MPVQDCILINQQQDGCFRLTVQSIDDVHTQTVDIIFPTSPQTGDMHLVDYNGDNWWVLYRYGASTWTIKAEIEGNQATTPIVEGQNTYVTWVNDDADGLLSQLYNPTKPYTSLEDTVTDIPFVSGDFDSVISGITNATYAYRYNPSVNQVILLGRNYNLSQLEVDAVNALDKQYNLVLNTTLLPESTVNLSDIFYRGIDIKGYGSIALTSALTTNKNLFVVTGSEKTAIDIDLNSIFFKTATTSGNLNTGASAVFDLADSEAITNINLNHVVVSNAGLVRLPSDTNESCDIQVKKLTSFGGNVHVVSFPSLSIGSATLGRKESRIDIGNISNVSITGLILLKGYSTTLYGYQNLYMNVDLIDKSDFDSAYLIDLASGDYTGSNINLNVGTLKSYGYVLNLNGGTFAGKLRVGIDNTIVSGTLPANSSLLLANITNCLVTNQVKLEGNYTGSIRISGTSEIDDLRLSGEFYTKATGTALADTPFMVFVNSTPAVTHRVYLNNCKIIVEETTSSLIDESGTAMAGTLELVCTNVSTNAMGALPGWVTVIGSIDQNANYA